MCFCHRCLIKEQIEEFQNFESPLMVSSVWEHLEYFHMITYAKPLWNNDLIKHMVDAFDISVWYFYSVLISCYIVFIFLPMGDNRFSTFNNWRIQCLLILVWSVTVASFIFFFTTGIRRIRLEPELRASAEKGSGIIYIDPSFRTFFVEGTTITFKTFEKSLSESQEVDMMRHHLARKLSVLSDKTYFNIFIKHFLRSNRGNSNQQWEWRLSDENLAGMGQNKMLLHDKHNPHLRRITRLLSNIQAGALLERNKTLLEHNDSDYASLLNTKRNPRIMYGTDYEPNPLRQGNLQNLLTINFIGFAIALFMWICEAFSGRRKTIKWTSPIIKRTPRIADTMKIIFFVVIFIAVDAIFIRGFNQIRPTNRKPLFTFGTTSNAPMSPKDIEYSNVMKSESLQRIFPIKGFLRTFVYSEIEANYTDCNKTIMPNLYWYPTKKKVESEEDMIPTPTLGAQIMPTKSFFICQYAVVEQCFIISKGQKGPNLVDIQTDDFTMFTTLSRVRNGENLWMTGLFPHRILSLNDTLNRRLLRLLVMLTPVHQLYRLTVMEIIAFAKPTTTIIAVKEENDTIVQVAAPTMPIKSASHCIIELDRDSVFMYSDDMRPHEHEAFIYSFKSDHWKPIPQKSPCKRTKYSWSLTMRPSCAKRRRSDNNLEIIIPSYDFKTHKRCTAILNTSTYQWYKVQMDDTRLAVDFGVAISAANDARILYLGGIDANKTKLNTVYELIEDKEWVLRPEASLPIGSMTNDLMEMTYFPVDIDNCE